MSLKVISNGKETSYINIDKIAYCIVRDNYASICFDNGQRIDTVDKEIITEVLRIMAKEATGAKVL